MLDTCFTFFYLQTLQGRSEKPGWVVLALRRGCCGCSDGSHHFSVAVLGFALTWGTVILFVSRVLIKLFWLVYCFYVVSAGWAGVGISYSTVLLMSFSNYFLCMVWNLGGGSSFSIWWSNTIFKKISFSYRVISVPCQNIWNFSISLTISSKGPSEIFIGS